MALTFLIPFSAGVALAEHCTVSKIAIVAGTWENTDTKTSYMVQTQDSVGTVCHLSETLRLSFASSGVGTFTSSTGDPIQQVSMSKHTANRNFYYQNTTGTNDVLTVQGGLWETSHNTSTPLSTDEQDEASDTADIADDGAGGQGGTSIAQTSNTKKTPESESSTLARPRAFQDDPLKLVLSHPKRVSASQPVLFVATPRGLEDAELRTLRYLWSFGDSSTSTSRTPTHVYWHPGNYIVIGIALRAGHEIAIRTEVMVLPLRITLGRNVRGDLLIQNDASYEIEISRLMISDGTRRFTVPDYTYLLSRALIALPLTLTGFTRHWSIAFAYDRERTLLAQYPTAEPNTEWNVQENMEGQGGAQIRASTEGAETEEIITASPTETVADDIASTADSIIATDEATNQGSATTTILVTNTEAKTHPGQLATAAKYDQTETPAQTAGASSPWWVVPSAFVGVLLMGVLALYIHKVV